MRIIGKIIKTILLLILGMILGIVGLFAGMYYVVAKMPLKNVESLIPVEQDIISDSIEDLSLLETLQFLADSNTTIKQIEEAIPFASGAIDQLINNPTLNAFISIDKNKLENLSIGNMSQIAELIEITATLNSLSDTFNFDLGDLGNLSIFKTETRAVEAYVQISGALDSNYDETKTVYGYNVSEELIEKASLDATGYDAFLQLKDITEDELKYLCYQSNGEYLPCLNTENLNSMQVYNANGPFFVHKQGLGDIPITNAINQLSTKIYEVKVGEFVEGESGLISALRDLTLKDLADGNYQEELDGIYLADVIGASSNKIINSILYKADNTTKVTIGELGERIEELKLKDVLEINETSPFFIRSYADLLISELDHVDMTLSHIFDMNAPDLDPMVKGLLYKRTNGTYYLPEGYTINSAGKVLTPTSALDGRYIQDGNVYDEHNNLLGKYAYALDANYNKIENVIEDLPTQVHYLRLDEVIDCTQSDLLAVLAQKNVSLTNIATEINHISLSEICQHEVFTEVTFASFDSTYALYGFDEETGNYHLVTTYAGGSYSINSGITASSYDGFYKISSSAGAWAFISFDYEETYDAIGNSTLYTKKNVTIENMDASLNNVALMFSNATVKQLVDIGVLDSGINSVLYPMTLKNALSLI